MRKIKIKKRHKIFMPNNLIIIIIFTISALMGISYSLFSSTLNIRGRITAGGNTKQDTLETIIVPSNPENNEYGVITTVPAKSVNFIDNYLEENRITVNLETVGKGGQSRDITLSFELKNSGIYNYLSQGYTSSSSNRGAFMPSEPTINNVPNIMVGET